RLPVNEFNITKVSCPVLLKSLSNIFIQFIAASLVSSLDSLVLELLKATLGFSMFFLPGLLQSQRYQFPPSKLYILKNHQCMFLS
ncbi:MAG: hypothetical protein ACKPKO_30370, partial [Candidatus Fonsibacter sp.]